MSEYDAFSRVFEGVRTNACLFHLSQAHFKHVRDLGLAKRYNMEVAVRRTVRWCTSLAFLPPDIVRRGLSLIIDQAPIGMAKFLRYVGKYYIGLSQWEIDNGEAAFQSNADEQRMMNGMVGHSTPQSQCK